jgi:hypothetical protein
MTCKIPTFAFLLAVLALFSVFKFKASALQLQAVRPSYMLLSSRLFISLVGLSILSRCHFNYLLFNDIPLVQRQPYRDNLIHKLAYGLRMPRSFGQYTGRRPYRNLGCMRTYVYLFGARLSWSFCVGVVLDGVQSKSIVFGWLFGRMRHVRSRAGGLLRWHSQRTCPICICM